MNSPKSVIYMADDDADDRFFMQQALQKADPSVVVIEAEDGGALLALLEAHSQASAATPIHLILLDMNMPRFNGLETLAAIKADPLLRHIPAVMLSTSAEPDQVLTAYQHGINGYIQKPVTYTHMDQIVQAISICFLTTPFPS